MYTELIKIVVANRSVIKIAASSGLARGLEKRNDPERIDIEQLRPFTEFSLSRSLSLEKRFLFLFFLKISLLRFYLSER